MRSPDILICVYLRSSAVLVFAFFALFCGYFRLGLARFRALDGDKRGV
jgi:hypothetical protein